MGLLEKSGQNLRLVHLGLEPIGVIILGPVCSSISYSKIGRSSTVHSSTGKEPLIWYSLSSNYQV
jgi:hypothetical protein